MTPTIVVFMRVLNVRSIAMKIKALTVIFHERPSSMGVIFISCFNTSIIEPRSEKAVFGVSDQVRHEPGWTATENGQRLEISDLSAV